MGLVVVAAIQRDLGPIDLLSAVNRYQRLLKSPYTAESLWRQPHLLAEELDKSPRTEANLSRQPRNRHRMRHAAKMVQRIVHRGMPCKRPGKLVEQVLLKDLKHCGYALRSEHALS